jgi:hypothetical protein
MHSTASPTLPTLVTPLKNKANYVRITRTFGHKQWDYSIPESWARITISRTFGHNDWEVDDWDLKQALDLVKSKIKVIPGVALKCGYFEFEYNDNVYYHISKIYGKNGFMIYRQLPYYGSNPYIAVVRDSRAMVTNYDLKYTPVRLEISKSVSKIRQAHNVLFSFQL